MPYHIEDLVRLHDDIKSGPWFSKETMRFFGTRLTGNFKRLDDFNALFITTEHCPWGEDHKRLASVRHARLETYLRETNGRSCQRVVIRTVGEFNKLTLARAKTLMRDTELKEVQS